MMVLETLSEDQDSIIVYSRNILSNDNNFRMILKSDPDTVPKKLYLYDICGLINHPVPKNLVVYRIMTNMEELAVIESRYGCFIQTGDGKELIYPDPVYAVKELEEFSEEQYIPQLKFRIQQVGFTTGFLTKDSIVFSEAFRFDLDSLEAQAQNDTVFVQAFLKSSPENPADAEVSLLEELKFNESIELVRRTEESPAYEDDDEITFRSIVHPGKIQSGPILPMKKGQPMISIFRSAEVLKEYIKKKKYRKFILKLRRL